jgi:ribosomal protein S18 acetylase RimI-like enzyme
VRLIIKDVAAANFHDIPEPCRGCTYWEFPEEFDKAKEEKTMSERRAEFERKKLEWFARAIREFGTCGKIAYHDSKPVAYAQFAPSERLPNTNHYKSHPVGKSEEGAVFLSCLYVPDKELRRGGIGGKLLKNIINDLRCRGFKAIETFARSGNAENPSGPLEFFVKNGFRIKDQTSPEFPLVRLSL